MVCLSHLSIFSEKYAATQIINDVTSHLLTCSISGSTNLSALTMVLNFIESDDEEH